MTLAQHLRATSHSLLLFAPSEESLPDALRLLSRFNFMTELFALDMSPIQVRVYFALVFQIVTDHRIHIGSGEHVILLDDLFRRGTFIKSGNDRIE
jgi:hypothetical protein